MGWIVWDFAFTVPPGATRAQRLRMLAAVPVFCLSALMVNYRLLGGLLEFSYGGNQITSERLEDYGGHGPATTALNLLAPLGLRGSGPFAEPYVPYFYGLLAGFLVLLGVVQLVRRSSNGAPPPNTWVSFALIGPLLLGVLSLYGSAIIGALYAIGAPGFPFHTGIRILHPVHTCVMILLAVGLDALVAVGDNAGVRLDRVLVFKVFVVFLVLAALLGPLAPGADAQHLQLLFAIITVLVGCWLPMQPVVRMGVVGGLLIVTSLLATRDFTMVTGAAYHSEVLSRARLNRKVASNTLPARLIHPEDFAPRVYPLSLHTLLMPMREDISNPRTRLYAWNFIAGFREDLARLIKFRARGGDAGSDPSMDDAHAALSALDRLHRDVGSYERLDVPHLEELLKLSPVYDRLRYHEQAGGLRELDRILSSIPVSAPYPRVAFSDAFKSKVGGDALNDFPTFENSHYYVMGAANLRWSSNLDYFFPEVDKAIAQSRLYDANMFPPVSREYLDLLGFDFIVAAEGEAAALQPNTELIARLPNGVLLRNKAALPRASLFRQIKVIPPIRYDTNNFESMERIARGRAELNAIDTKKVVLLEAEPSRGPSSDGGAQGGQVEIMRIASNFAVFRVDNPGGDGILFYSDAYHPDWRAYVDRTRREVLRADLGFKAVVVPPGKHLVWMEFAPRRAELLRAFVWLLSAYVLVQVARSVARRRVAEGARI